MSTTAATVLYDIGTLQASEAERRSILDAVIAQEGAAARLLRMVRGGGEGAVVAAAFLDSCHVYCGPGACDAVTAQRGWLAKLAAAAARGEGAGVIAGAALSRLAIAAPGAAHAALLSEPAAAAAAAACLACGSAPASVVACGGKRCGGGRMFAVRYLSQAAAAAAVRSPHIDAQLLCGTPGFVPSLLLNLEWALGSGQRQAAAASLAALDSVTRRGEAEAWAALWGGDAPCWGMDVLELLEVDAMDLGEAAAAFAVALRREWEPEEERREAAAAAAADAAAAGAEQGAGGEAAAAAAPEREEEGDAVVEAVRVEGPRLHAVACAACGRAAAPGVQLKLCVGCRSVRYCSEACAKAAWPAGHREECRELKAQRKAAAAAAPKGRAVAAGV
ncbi:MAG: hypothetical protein J3K34DRAFT_518623 [Monoraphidium minutum]|nr:MAG: hypothetical protein J3K34DRAFT_518623 [Monoraphidium minutum]